MKLCPHCREPVEDGSMFIPPDTWHWECVLRTVVGGVNHLLGRCRCYHGTEPADPPEMTRREAARAACREYTFIRSHYTPRG